MRILLKVGFFILVFINIFLSSWYVLHNDINFSSEIARDFLLLNELDQKKIVLIGPSSSTSLFHGPLWAYLNYPAYVIGNGNPIAVGWFWILLIIFFLISNYYYAKKLFNKNTAYLFVLMTSLYMSFHSYRFYNPHGAMLLIPSFFFFFIRYLQTKKSLFLVLHLLVGSAMIQFQLAVGIPLMILSMSYIAFISIKEKRFLQLTLLSLVLVGVLNFIVFDLRHNHLLLNILLHYANSAGRDKTDYLPLIQERVQYLLGSMEFMRADPGGRNMLWTFVAAFFIFFQIKDKMHKVIYYSFMYFYVGFFVLSFINAGKILYFYLFPLFPLVYLIFCSFVTSRFKNAFLIIFFIIYFLNFKSSVTDLIASQGAIGKDLYSWKLLNEIAQDAYKGKEKEFGYFVYAPNVFAYEGKYAMLYNQKQTNKKADYFTKKKVTYLIIAPPPPDNPFMKDRWWTENQVNIKTKPVETKKYVNGYKIERYELTKAEQAIPPSSTFDPGLSFR